MIKLFSKILDFVSNYLARRKGLLPIIGILLILINFGINLFSKNWLSESDIFLHLGIIIAIIGFMLQKAL